MRGLATVAAVTALALATVADLAVAKPTAKAPGHGPAKGHQQQKTVRAVKPAAPVRQKRAPAPARRTAKRGSEPTPAPAKPKRSATVGTTTVQRTPTTSTAVDGCKADPGSCQERGRGNSGDIDPYRGPDAPGNNPSRGNDCDEGGGNNRGSYPRRTNPSNPGDSPVDNDRGRGNNRCGGAAGPGPGKDDPSSTKGPSDRIEVLDVIRAGGVVPALEAPADIEQRDARSLEERADDPGRGGLLGGQKDLLPVDTSLPFTGKPLLALFLTGSLLALAGLGLRKRVGA